MKEKYDFSNGKRGSVMQKWTYADYCTWPDNERCELIDGVRHDFISSTPPPAHQRVLGALFVKFADFLDGQQCEVYVDPFDVRLPDFEGQPDDEITTVVHPDLAVICDPEKLDDRGCKGAPTLIVEILSPHTAEYDWKIKQKLYQRVGVKEFWIVYPTDTVAIIFRLNDAGVYDLHDVWKLRTW